MRLTCDIWKTLRPPFVFFGEYDYGAISRDGTVVALSRTDDVTIFEVASADQLAAFQATSAIRRMTMWESQRLAATNNKGEVTVWNLDARKRLCTVQSLAAYECRFSHNGEQLLLWDDTKGTEVVDIASGQVTATFADGVGGAFNTAGDTIVLRGRVGKQLAVFNATQSETLCRLDWNGTTAVISADATLVATRAPDEKTLCTFDAVTGTRLCEFLCERCGEHSRELAFTPDSRLLLVARGVDAIDD